MPKSVVVQFRVTEAQMFIISERAKASKQSISNFLRALACETDLSISESHEIAGFAPRPEVERPETYVPTQRSHHPRCPCAMCQT